MTDAVEGLRPVRGFVDRTGEAGAEATASEVDGKGTAVISSVGGRGADLGASAIGAVVGTRDGKALAYCCKLSQLANLIGRSCERTFGVVESCGAIEGA